MTLLAIIATIKRPPGNEQKLPRTDVLPKTYVLFIVLTVFLGMGRAVHGLSGDV